MVTPIKREHFLEQIDAVQSRLDQWLVQRKAELLSCAADNVDPAEAAEMFEARLAEAERVYGRAAAKVNELRREIENAIIE
jgi:hypothetical protein